MQRKSLLQLLSWASWSYHNTSPDIISTIAPITFWWAELISQFFCYSNSSKNITYTSGKLKTEFTSPIAKSTLRHYFLCMLYRQKMIETQTHGCAIKRKPLQGVFKVESRLSSQGRGGGIRGKGAETRKIKERGEVSKTDPLSSSSFLYFFSLVRWYTLRGTGSVKSWTVNRLTL